MLPQEHHDKSGLPSSMFTRHFLANLCICLCRGYTLEPLYEHLAENRPESELTNLSVPNLALNLRGWNLIRLQWLIDTRYSTLIWDTLLDAHWEKHSRYSISDASWRSLENVNRIEWTSYYEVEAAVQAVQWSSLNEHCPLTECSSNGFPRITLWCSPSYLKSFESSLKLGNLNLFLKLLNFQRRSQ